MVWGSLNQRPEHWRCNLPGEHLFRYPILAKRKNIVFIFFASTKIYAVKMMCLPLGDDHHEIIMIKK
jgi:hypothetical protein